MESSGMRPKQALVFLDTGGRKPHYAKGGQERRASKGVRASLRWGKREEHCEQRQRAQQPCFHLDRWGAQRRGRIK